MFSFLSRVRSSLGGSAPQPQEDIEDTASIRHRNLALPFPVPETRRQGGPHIPHSQHLGSTQNLSISHPIPRTNSLTAPDGPGHGGSGSLRRVQLGAPSSTPPAQSAVGLWYSQEKASRRLLAAQSDSGLGTENQSNGPPAVVRIDSGAFSAAVAAPGEYDDTAEGSTPPPRYAYADNPNPTTTPYAAPDSQAGYFLPMPPSSDRSTPDLADNRIPHHRPSESNPEFDHHYESTDGLYASPFDANATEHGQFAVPVPAPSTISSSSSGSSGPSNGQMTKGKWGLKLQLQQLQFNSGHSSMPSLPSQSTNMAAMSSAQQRYTHPTHGAYDPVAATSVETDVYKHAYNYNVKQLSPIAEQDYFSPTPQSDATAFFKFGPRSAAPSGMSRQGSNRASPGAESILCTLAKEEAEVDDRASVKVTTRAGRSGSVSSVRSVRTLNGSKVSMSLPMPPTPVFGPDGTQKGTCTPLGTPGGSDAPKPSPFITRHLNRTVSQTSTMSDAHSQQANQSPAPSQTHTPVIQPQTPRSEFFAQAQQTALRERMGHLSTSTMATIVPRDRIPVSAAPLSGHRDVVQTPISAASTTFFTPTSAVSHQVPTPYSSNQSTSTPLATPTIAIQHPPGAMLANTPPVGTPSGGIEADAGPVPGSTLPHLPSLPNISPIDIRYSSFGSIRSRHSPLRNRHGGIDKMPRIEGSVEGHHYEEEDETESEDGDDYDEVGLEVEEVDDSEDEEYERESLHAESFVTASGNPAQSGVELANLGNGGTRADTPSSSARSRSARGDNSIRSGARTEPQSGPTPQPSMGESFIDRRWDRDVTSGLSSAPATATTFRAKSSSKWPLRLNTSSTTFTPAFWTFWLGFVCPMLWLVGGWLFTNVGEMPPKYTIWEWCFWNRRWRTKQWAKMMSEKMRDVFSCCRRRKPHNKKQVRESDDSGVAVGEQQMVPSARPAKPSQRGRTFSQSSNARAGKVYPALPRWVAEKQSTDDGRMRLNDPKRSLRGIQFGYPFVPRPPTSHGSVGSQPIRPPKPFLIRILVAPNRALDQLYGVKLREVHGRPESGRRMFDPWIQRCRYAFCYGMLLLAVGLCSVATYLLIVNINS